MREAPEGPAPGETVLVVDDDPDFRRAACRALERLGFEALSAADGEDGLARALEVRPSVILVDLWMPGVDGLALLRRLAPYKLPSAVVVMSGQAGMEDVVAVMRAGAVDYLQKPWTANQLLESVNRAAEIHRGRVAAEAALERHQAAAATTGAVRERADAAADLVLRLEKGEVEIPSVPDVVVRLRLLLGRTEIRMEEVVALLERDPRLTAQLLRLSNSGFYARGVRNTDLHTAVGRIGLRPLHALVETTFMHDCYQVRHPMLRALERRVWAASVGRAAAMRHLATLSAPDLGVDADNAYLAGLLCDVGASFLLWLLDERAALTGAGADEGEALEAVRTHHQRVGPLVLDRWGFAGTPVALARHHHADPRTPFVGSYTRLAVLGMELARAIGAPDVTTADAIPTATVERCMADLGLDAQRLAAAQEEVAREVQDVLGSFPPSGSLTGSA